MQEEVIIAPIEQGIGESIRPRSLKGPPARRNPVLEPNANRAQFWDSLAFIPTPNPVTTPTFTLTCADRTAWRSSKTCWRTMPLWTKLKLTRARTFVRPPRPCSIKCNRISASNKEMSPCLSWICRMCRHSTLR